MKTTAELNKMISDITSKINSEYPELVKFISEMRTEDSTDLDNVAPQDLLDYYNSLEDLIKRYSNTHHTQ